jgi:dihydroneopterin aldolase
LDNNIFRLSINDLRVWAHLGCTDEERFHPQTISFNISIDFTKPPMGADTGLLEDTVSYRDLVETVTLHCQGGRFNLIEALAKSVHQKISDSLAPYIHQLQSIEVTLHKISPPVPHVHGGVKWTHLVNYGGSL